MDEQELIENPEALGRLVQQAVRHLIEQRPDNTEQEAQLKEVAKTIERLEKLGLSIPEELRRLKVNLATQTNGHTHFESQLKMLGKNLSEALELIEATLEQSLVKQKPEDLRLSRDGRLSKEATSLHLKDMERQLILDALIHNQYNKAAVARELGIPLSTLKRRFKDYRISDEE